MKKISILSLHLGYGGIEKSIVALANLLCKDYEVEIACIYQLYDNPVFDLDERVQVNYLNPGLRPNKEEFLNAFHHLRLIKTFLLGLKAIQILWKKQTTMIRYIENSDADVLISTRDFLNSYLGDYGKKEVLKIGWEHNHYHENMSYADKVVDSAKKLDYFVLVSKNLQKYYHKRLQNYPCKCVYIPNIIDHIPKQLAPLNKKRLVSVGRLSEEKGYIDLLKIFYLLQKKHPDWSLDIVGDGDQKPILEKFIKKYRLEDKVILHGFQKKDYVDKILHNGSIYVMTSHTESFGIVLIEAMSHGLPCVAFNSAEGARELIKSGDNGYLIKNRNYRAMIKKLEDLMNDKTIRNYVGRKSRKSVKQYTGEEVIKKWYNVLGKK